MAEKRKPKSAIPATKRAPKTKKSAPKGEKTRAKSTATNPAKAKAARMKDSAKAAPAEKKASARPAPTKKPTRKKAPAKMPMRTVAAEDMTGYRIGEPVLDPIGDLSSGEGHQYLGEAEAPGEAELEAYRVETETSALDGTLEMDAEAAAGAREAANEAGTKEAKEAEGEPDRDSGPAPRLERLQKILSQAGIASRRRAEEMIVAGRVMVNGQVVTQLGSKADVARDHIRVDGKLLHGAERHRYFVLNKPRGYVTTVSDPEGRPTVMQFFTKMHERLYPVGRLDYQSEGLLLMTNDGELANLVTKAVSGVEKTYLVKVAGRPTEEQLERLRGGVAIERGEAGSERVRTAPTKIRQVRAGENPWYEVVLTEGRNRELRKMFAAIGHFAEKIRRVGYGPLELDVEPGKVRELRADEVNALRMTAEGKMKPRRMRVDVMLPKEAGLAAGKRGERSEKPWQDKPAGKRDRPPARSGKPFHPREERGQRTEWKPRERGFGAAREGGAGRSGDRPSFDKRRAKPFGTRPEFGRREGSKPFRSEERAAFGERGERPPRTGSDFSRRPSKPFGARPGFGGRPKFGGGERREFRGGPRQEFGGGPRREYRGAAPRREHSEGRVDGATRKPFGAQGGRPFPKPGEEPKKRFEGERPPFKPRGERPRLEGSQRPAFGGGGEAKRPYKGGGGKAFGKGKRFGAKPGGFGKSRNDGAREKRFGGSRPGAARGGWKRG